jgi:dipeptidyl aminopeptidase/acylaminoacyl peptidase
MRYRTILVRLTMTCLIGTCGPSRARSAATGDDDGERPRPETNRPADPLPLELAFSRRSFAWHEKSATSPTGKYVAYAVDTPVKQRNDLWTLPSGLLVMKLGTRLHVLELATGQSIALGGEGATTFTPAWSPEGTKLAYYSDEGGSLRAWVFDTTTAQTAPAADVRLKIHMYNPITLMPPTWSPDGRFLLVPGLPADETGADPRPARGKYVVEKTASASGPNVLVLAAGTEPAPPVTGRERTFSSFDTHVDLTAIDVATGSARILLPARLPGRPGPAFARYSPSGRYLAYATPLRPGPTAEADDVLDLGVVKAGAVEPVFLEAGFRYYDGYESNSVDALGRSGLIFAWHPRDDVLLFVKDNQLRRLDCGGKMKPTPSVLAADLGKLNGDYLAFTRDGRAVLVGLLPSDARTDSHVVSGLALVPLDGSAPRRWLLPEGFRSGQVIRAYGLTLWQSVADTATFLTPDAPTGRTLVRRLELAKGRWTTVETGLESVEIQGTPRDASFLIGTIQGYARPPDLYRFDPDLTPQRKLTEIEPRLKGRELGPVELFETLVPLHDGRLKPVRTAVFLPPGARKGDRLPAILCCYGGSDLSLRNTRYGGTDVSTIPAPVFTTRGYAVLMADGPLGPTGQPGQPVEELRDVILPQVYRAAELGYIDIGRVAVTGQSYGGYSAAALVSATNLFRAAVAVSGIYDLTSIQGVSRSDGFSNWLLEMGQGRMGQPPWSDFRRYLDNSPYARADRIRTPLLIVHGRDDPTCPVHDAEKMFSALRRLGRTAQLAVYAGEGHEILGWDQTQAVDAAERMLDFLRRHLATDREPSSER